MCFRGRIEISRSRAGSCSTAFFAVPSFQRLLQADVGGHESVELWTAFRFPLACDNMRTI